MRSMVALVHTVSPLVPEFDRLCSELLPGVIIKHVLDELLLERVYRRGRLAPEDAERLWGHVQMAVELGAAAVLVTCSTISPCVDAIRERASVPVIRIDDAMIAGALRLGTRVGVVATNATTLEPTRKSLLARAEASHRVVEVESILVEGALTALLAGDVETHDHLVAKAVLDLARHVDVVMLAQASTARVLPMIPQGPIPVLSSPRLALGQIREMIKTSTTTL